MAIETQEELDRFFPFRMKRKALLVAVNDYAPVGPGGPDLNGCVNDLIDLGVTLITMGVIPPTPFHLRILTDQRATKKNILRGLDWLLAGAKEGDLRIFSYSGHGTNVVDVDGDELDHVDEAICPHDYATAGVITDDEFQDNFENISRGVNLEVILDSCFSGTGTRELAAFGGLPEAEQMTIRYVDPPVDWGFFIDQNPGLPKWGIMKPRISIKGDMIRDAVIAPNMNHVLWAASRDNQTAAEAPIGGVTRGLFTYCFCSSLRNAGINVTRRRLDSLVSGALATHGASQRNQLEGTFRSLLEQIFT